MKHFFLFNVLVIFTFLNIRCNNCLEGFKTVTATILEKEWFPRVADVLNTIQIRLNNFTANKMEFDDRTEFAFLRTGDSHVTIGGLKKPIPGLDSDSLVRHPPFTVYINDINSASVSTGISRMQLKVQVQMENEGTEVMTDCLKSIICFETPSAEIDNAVVTFWLKPEVDSTGKLTVAGLADFSAQTQLSLCQDSFFAFLCDLFGINPGVINDGIKKRLDNILSDPGIQSRISALFMSFISPLVGPGEKLTSVLLTNSGDLTITKSVPCL